MRKISVLLMSLVMICMMSCSGNQKASNDNAAAADSTATDTTAVAKPTTKTIACRVFLKKGQEAAFLKAAQGLIDSTRTEPGNVSYDLYQSPTESTSFFFFEVYKNDAAFQAHANSSHFQNFANTIKPMLEKDLDIMQY